MSASLRIAYFAHSLRSDWNNGNAHFLRGLMRALVQLGHAVTIHEQENNWSVQNLEDEPRGQASLSEFVAVYPDLDIRTYREGQTREQWLASLSGVQIVILHEWHAPALAQQLLSLRGILGFRLLFHDTHHRASSSPAQIEAFGLSGFDGILAFGASLQSLYRQHFGLERVWVLHEAADITHFKPLPSRPRSVDGVWIGNWGENERSHEIREFFLEPATRLASQARFTIFGVRYPPEGLQALAGAGVHYGGYLPNLAAPEVYARSLFTVHIPRQQYTTAMAGIPTIRVFEALACGIPLLSAPWDDTEELFRPGDLTFVADTDAMEHAMRRFLEDPAQASAYAQRGMETVLARHTCDHRAAELTSICEELLS